MRFGVLLWAIAVLFSQSAMAGERVIAIPDRDYTVSLKPGEATDFNQLHLSCTDQHVTGIFGEDKAENRVGEGFGRGVLQAAFADCRLADGTPVRVKAGYGDAPMGTGECGADPLKILSIWIGHRKVVSKKRYVNLCSETFLKSMDVDAAGATICSLGKNDDPTPKDFSELPEKGVCERTEVTSAPEDGIEFSASTPPPDTLSPKGRRADLCRAMIKPGGTSRVAVPARFAQPKWTRVPPHENKIDEAKLGFDATSFAQYGTREAHFDLENSGKVQTVYQHDQDDHWFAGSAFANARPGILDVPFDAHDWERSWKSGIYAYVYDHVTVFFDRGRTYLLLDPENAVLDPRIVTLRDGKETEVCRLRRQPENF